MNIIFRFKIYENIVLNDKKQLYQLEHFKGKYTYSFKKLTYNDKRKAYRIYSQWVSLKRLNKLSYKVNEIIETEIKDKFLQNLDLAIIKLR